MLINFLKKSFHYLYDLPVKSVRYMAHLFWLKIYTSAFPTQDQIETSDAIAAGAAIIIGSTVAILKDMQIKQRNEIIANKDKAANYLNILIDENIFSPRVLGKTNEYKKILSETPNDKLRELSCLMFEFADTLGLKSGALLSLVLLIHFFMKNLNENEAILMLALSLLYGVASGIYEVVNRITENQEATNALQKVLNNIDEKLNLLGRELSASTLNSSVPEWPILVPVSTETQLVRGI